MLVTSIFKHLKIGCGMLTVKSHKFWALVFLRHVMIIEEE